MTSDDPLAEEPFACRMTGDGRVLISHRGRLVKTLRGAEAARFAARAGSADARAMQLLMARVTGQFRFGNERAARGARRGRTGE